MRLEPPAVGPRRCAQQHVCNVELLGQRAELGEPLGQEELAAELHVLPRRVTRRVARELVGRRKVGVCVRARHEGHVVVERDARVDHAGGHVRHVRREAGQCRERGKEERIGAQADDPVEAAVRRLVLQDGIEERAQLGPLLRRLHARDVIAHAGVGISAGIVVNERGRISFDGAIDQRVGDTRPELVILSRFAAWP